MRPYLHVQPDGRNPHWPAIAVVSGIGNVLEIEAGEEPRKQTGVVIRLPDVFPAIPQPSIADQKIVPAAREVILMDTGDSARRKFSGGRVERPAPPPPGNRNTTGSQAIDGGERETLRLPVIPTEPRKDADVLIHLLVHIQPESILQRPVAAHVHNNRSTTTPFRQP